jgi:hypothetical protein
MVLGLPVPLPRGYPQASPASLPEAGRLPGAGEELPLHDRDHGSPRTSREPTNPHVLSETGVELIFLAYKSTALVGGIVIPPRTRDTDQPPPSKDMR